MTTKQALANAIQSLIDLLDTMEADPDLEIEFDTGADDEGESEGITFMALDGGRAA